MTTGHSRRAWILTVLVLCFVPAARGRTMTSDSASGFGTDPNAPFWLLVPASHSGFVTVTVNGITVDEQVICTNQTLSGNLCTDGAYSFLYQVHSSGPFVTTFSRLSGFAFNNTLPTFGVMGCDPLKNNTIALCGYDSTILSKLSFDTPNATLSISTPTTGSLGYITLFLKEMQNAGLPPILPLLSVNGVSLTPSSLAFGSQAIGTSGPPQTLTLTNNFSTSLTISNIVPPSGFGSNIDCTGGVPAVVPAGSTCAISIWAAPGTASPFSGNLNISDNSLVSAETASFSAYGGASAVTLVPATVPFGTQTAGGTASAVLSQAFENNTGSTFRIVSISGVTADLNSNNVEFTIDNTSTCLAGVIMGAGAACTLNVGFPNGTADTGELMGTVTVTVAPYPTSCGIPCESSYTFALHGFAGSFSAMTGSTMSSAITLNFPLQSVGTVSATQTVTFTNNSGGSLNIVNVNASADFTAVTGTCVNPTSSVPLANGASCTVDVAFSPTAAGVRTGAITIADDVTDGTQVIVVSGTGVFVKKRRGQLISD